MQRFVKLLLAAALAAPLAATAAFAHAFLDHGVPGVGMTVSGPVRELRLYYTQGVVTAFSAVSVTSSAGAAIPASKPVNDPSDQQTVIVRLGRALGPGTYTVSWRCFRSTRIRPRAHSTSRSLENGSPAGRLAVSSTRPAGASEPARTISPNGGDHDDVSIPRRRASVAQDVAKKPGPNGSIVRAGTWMTYLPLVIARWIHFASVFVLFGSSFFWFYMPSEHSLAHPGRMARRFARQPSCCASPRRSRRFPASPGSRSF